MKPNTKVGDTRIVRAAIHPAIGIARIGNSKQGYYIGPEVTDPAPTPGGGHRDDSGAILRQAARFRIYGYNSAGQVVGEIDSDDADISWTVHVANRKAAWYQFDRALDIPEAVGVSTSRRNASVVGDARRTLVIDPGPCSIDGKDSHGPQYVLDSGQFMGTPVYLGELRTDSCGRLLFLGGRGVSASPDGAPIYDPADPATFNNADGWYDDTSDGPVSARVVIDGRTLPVEGAWVVTAPPNYAPDVIGWRTLQDLLMDSYVEAGWMPFPETISFSRDILPTLQRLSGLQWVNKGFAAQFGTDGPLDLDDPRLVGKLAESGDTYAELRRTVFNSFRAADNTGHNPSPWPWIYGDAFGTEHPQSSRNNLALPEVRYRYLEMWVEGRFVSDWDSDAKSVNTLSALPLVEQPATLDRAALHFCLADAFHPGCELTWPMRHTSMFHAPFRIRRRGSGLDAPDYGGNLTPEIALRPGGPLYDQGPGDLTRWMALPWQADTAFCRSGYDHEYDPYVPTFWPARVPNQVLTASDYAVVIDTNRPREERLAAFHRRAQWLRSLSGSAPEQMQQMVAGFGSMGIVEACPGVVDDPDFPAVMWVESLPGDSTLEAAPSLAAAQRAAATPTAGTSATSLEQAGWESEAQCEEFRRVRRW